MKHSCSVILQSISLRICITLRTSMDAYSYLFGPYCARKSGGPLSMPLLVKAHEPYSKPFEAT
jgi:hypothetical protein